MFKFIKLFILGQGQLIGEEDIISQSPTYQTSAQCLSSEADIYEIRLEEFVKL